MMVVSQRRRTALGYACICTLLYEDGYRMVTSQRRRTVLGYAGICIVLRLVIGWLDHSAGVVY